MTRLKLWKWEAEKVVFKEERRSIERLDLGDADSHGMAVRWMREDYDAVKHDKCFSEWKVSLIPLPSHHHSTSG